MLGLELFTYTTNYYVLVLHFSCSLSFRVCRNPSPSLPNQFNITRTLLLSCVMWLLVIRMFFNSVSNLHNFSYFYAAFQSNVGCFSVGLLDLGAACICLLLLTGLSASYMAIMATLITACIISCVMLCSETIFLFWFSWVPVYYIS